MAVSKKLEKAEELLTIAEVAKVAKLSDDTIRRAIKAGELGRVELRGAVRISVSQYNDWIRRNAADASY